MKFILIPIFILLVLIQTFSKWLMVMEYNLNKDFISRNLCVNKAKPKLHCNGKCQMIKQMAEEEKQNSNETTSTTKLNIQDQVLTCEFNKLVIPLLTYVTLPCNGERPLLRHNPPVLSIFHPPALG